MSDDESDSNLRRLARLICRTLGTMLAIHFIGKWILSKSNDAWLDWVRDDWLSVLLIDAIVAVLVSVPVIFGLSNNRYIDRG